VTRLPLVLSVAGLLASLGLVTMNQPKHSQILPLDSRVLSSGLMAIFCFHVIWYWPTGTRGE
jgi:hypothetical protein